MSYTGLMASEYVNPHEVQEYHPLITRKGYQENSFSPPAANRHKLASLIRAFRADIYDGPPVLLLNEQALTGTHRIYAARLAKASLPVLKIKTDSDTHDAIMAAIGESGHYEDIPDILRQYGFTDGAAVMEYEADRLFQRSA